MLAGHRGLPVRARALALFLPSLLAGLLLTAGPAQAAPSGSAGTAPDAVVRTADDEPADPQAVVTVQAESPGPGAARLAVTVTAPGGAPLEGSVDVAEGGSVSLGSAPLVAGSAVLDLDATPGEHTYTVTFRSTDETVSATQVATVQVLDLAVPVLTLAPSSPAVGVARVSVALAVAGEPLDGATVEVREGDRVLAAALPLVDGTGVFETAGLTPGRHSWTVSYAGTDRIAPTAREVVVDVRDRDAAALTVLATSSAAGEVALDVEVTAGGAPVTGGTVTIKEGSTTRAAGIGVSEGVATWSASGQSAGPHTYLVSYSGTSTVKPASTTTTATVRDREKSSVTVRATSSAVGKLSLRVEVTAAGAPVTGGTVTIKEGSKTRASGLKISRGVATWSASRLPSGRHTYSVSYSGSPTALRSTATVTATVKAKAKPKVGLAASSTAPNRVSIKVTVSATGQTGLGGTVSVKDGSKTVKSGLTVRGGRASWSATGVKAGKHTYTVTYSGTSQVTSGSAKVSVTVRSVKAYANCTALNRDYAHGVGRSGAHDEVSGSSDPVTNFLVHTALYNANKKSDRDKDGIACERH